MNSMVPWENLVAVVSSSEIVGAMLEPFRTVPDWKNLFL